MPGFVRIVGGAFRRSRLPVPSRPGLRPTPDRVRETLFNWLGQDLTGWDCLDAFAGTGVLGLEAASRAAASVELVERDPALARHIAENAQRLGAAQVRVTAGDALAQLARLPPGHLDLIFLDPPYGSGLLTAAIPLAAAALRPGGWLYLEDDHAWPDTAAADWGFEPWRAQQAGQVHAHLWRRSA